ncbi:MAG TPA: glycosyltransferase family 39 protein [Pyrinomonadaceae bacterium]|nr:glycosyltransferase family 39 protein [Pyrinomonadaceae bacterium]
MTGHLKGNSATLTDVASENSSWDANKVSKQDRILALEWSVIGTLAIFIILGFGLRVSKLPALGFAEDEINKLEAVRSYQRGDISANAEHPMLMKVLMFISLTRAWQSGGPDSLREEFALRLPNAIVGALTVIPLFLLTAAFFDRWTGLLAAGFWAVGVNAIAMNRIGKEDTLLVFFTLFAFYYFLRAKLTPPAEQKKKRNSYIFSAASFGLMLASKYFPHYLGLNMLFHHLFHVRPKQPGEPSGSTPKLFYILIIVVFLVANPAVLLPQVWDYLNAYMGGQLLVHTGYLFGGQLYKNNMSSTPFWGTPLYFYLLFMAIKIPLVVLAAFVAGLLVAIKNRRDSGHAFLLFMFLFWIVPFSLIGGKWLRYTLSLMPFVYMIAAVGVMALISLVSARVSSLRYGGALVSAIAVLIFMVVPAAIAYANNPHYALYTNALAADKAGYYFPHDEFYDDGLREAIKYVCDNAPQNAIIAHETPVVARYYLERYGRIDLKSQAMSARDFDPAKIDGPAYFILQRGRTYFENREKLAYIRANFKKAHETQVRGLTACEIFAGPQ